jgi:hypothetical protein
MWEIQRYLAAVDLFRAEGCGPRWITEDLNGLVQRVTMSLESNHAGQSRS